MAISLVSDDAPAEKCVPCYLEGTFDYAIGKSCGTVGLMLLDFRRATSCMTDPIGKRSD
jgi:hypothetical protein